MIAPRRQYHEVSPGTLETALLEVRQILSQDPLAGPETIAELLGAETWLVEAALEALAVEGEVLP